MDSITLVKSSVRGGRDGRLRSAAATKSSPLRFCPFGLEDSALSFLWFWRGRSLFSAATSSSWLAYRSAVSKRSFTDSGCRRASFLSRSGSLIPITSQMLNICLALIKSHRHQEKHKQNAKKLVKLDNSEIFLSDHE